MIKNNIRYPEKHSEAEVQSLLWYFLRKKKIDARLQVTGYSEKEVKYCCKMDLVVFVDKSPQIIVECKSWSANYARTARYRRLSNTKQLRKYRELYSLPVLVCGRMTDITQTIKTIECHLNYQNRPIVKEV